MLFCNSKSNPACDDNPQSRPKIENKKRPKGPHPSPSELEFARLSVQAFAHLLKPRTLRSLRPLVWESPTKGHGPNGQT